MIPVSERAKTFRAFDRVANVIGGRRPPFTRQEDFWYSFLLETESTPEP
jgi:hypothetical protein